MVLGKAHETEGTADTGGEPVLSILLLPVWAVLDNVACVNTDLSSGQ